MRPWLAHYDADVAHSIAPYPDKTLIDYLADLRVLTVTGPRCCSRERRCRASLLETQSDAFAAAVVSLACVLATAWRYLPIARNSWCAVRVWKAGGVVVALNPIYSERELEAALESTGCWLSR